MNDDPKNRRHDPRRHETFEFAPEILAAGSPMPRLRGVSQSEAEQVFFDATSPSAAEESPSVLIPGKTGRGKSPLPPRQS